eukprot:103413_1
MQLYVKWLTFETSICTLHINSDDTIADLRAMIAPEVGEEPEAIMIFQQRSRLLSINYLNESVSSCHLQNLDTVHVRLNYGFIEKRRIKNAYKHTPSINNCPYMNNDDEKEKSCPIYEKLKKGKSSQKDLEHMQLYIHCAIKLKVCPQQMKCKSYQALLNGGNNINDQCHVRVYCHPPRIEQRKKSGYHPFKFSGIASGGIVVSDAIDNAQKGLNLDQKKENELLSLLIAEIKRNKFEKDLKRSDGTLLLDIAKQKLNHSRHIAMKSPLNAVEMLSIILYTEASCNYNLCRCQRNGDYKTWVVFDYILDKAIKKLAAKEYGCYPLFSGIGDVRINFEEEKGTCFSDKIPYIKAYLCTFTSTSWDKSIAKRFAGSRGMIVAFESDKRKEGCDVSWISKYGESEKEILFSRGGKYGHFSCVSQTDSMQYIVFGSPPPGNEKIF